MTEGKQVFYYSRRKLGIYLLFNLGLLALAILFTWSIFPDYPPVYYFALTTCTLSILSSLFVFLVPLPLAVIDSESIKIDRNQPLLWSQIKKVEKVNLSHFGLSRQILRITPQKLDNYRMGFMQKIVGHSQYGSFSIPLYAMKDDNAAKIEKLIQSHVAPQPTKKVKPATPKTPVKKGPTSTTKATKKVAPKKDVIKKAPAKKTTAKKATPKK